MMTGKKISVMASMALAAAAFFIMPVQAKEGKIVSGIYAEDIDLSGMTETEAKEAIEAYVATFGDAQITLHAPEEGEITASAADLGLKWGNQEILDEAASFGRDGDILQCYKELRDLEYQNKVYEISFDFDKDKIHSLIEENASQYDQEAVNATLQKTESGFEVTEGQSGRVVDRDGTTDAVYDYLINEWDGGACDLDMQVEVSDPQGTAEDLEKVKDVLGTFTTSYSTSGGDRSANVANGCSLINGSTIYPGEEFSAYEAVSPFTVENGYHMAGSYLNGQVVDSLGGGICQVSTTLYNAVLLSELEVTERHNHSMIVTYVDPSADAAIAESAGKDFKFINNTEHPIYIDGYCENKNITFTIYGVETRPANREVIYESEVLSVINPDHEVIYTNVAMPIGQVVTQSAHIGYKAQLWKIVKENGTEVSREQINSSSYKMVPRTATVGLSTNDVNAYNEMLAAVATNNIDHVKNVAASLAQFAIPAEQPPAEQAPPAEQPAEEQAPPAEQPPAEQPPAEQPEQPAQ